MQVMTLTAYIPRASPGEGDCKSRNCTTQPLSLPDPKTQNPDPRNPEGFRAATRKERRGPRDWHLAQAKMHILGTEFGAKSTIFFQVYGGRSRV